MKIGELVNIYDDYWVIIEAMETIPEIYLEVVEDEQGP